MCEGRATKQVKHQGSALRRHGGGIPEANYGSGAYDGVSTTLCVPFKCHHEQHPEEGHLTRRFRAGSRQLLLPSSELQLLRPRVTSEAACTETQALIETCDWQFIEAGDFTGGEP